MPISKASYEDALKILNTIGGAKSRADWDAAVKRLVTAQVSVHVISYVEYARLAYKGKNKKWKGSSAPAGSVLSSGIQNAGIDPTMPPDEGRRPVYERHRHPRAGDALVTMLKETSAAVQKAIDEKKTLEQMKKEKILAAWSKWSGEFVNEDVFIETLYNSLTGHKGEFVKHN